jgi:hypothetical protein
MFASVSLIVSWPVHNNFSVVTLTIGTCIYSFIEHDALFFNFMHKVYALQLIIQLENLTDS